MTGGETFTPTPRPPGLVGMIAEWIDACAVHPAPELSLAASLCTVATLCGRRYALASGLRPCLYIVGVARSGVGKEIGRQCAASLLDRTGYKRRLGTDDLASAAGLIARLRSCPTQLFLLDELGRLIEAYTSKNAGTHERQIVTTLMRLWSAHSGRFLGRAYAERETPAVEHPHPVVYGTTTPGAFWRSLRGTDVVDGVLSRFLVIEQPGAQQGEVVPTGRAQDPPSELVTLCKAIAHGPADASGNLSDVESADLLASPHIVALSPGAAEGARRLAENIRGKLDGMGEDGHEELWVRAREQTMRVALTVALGCGSMTVEESHLQWAWQLVRKSTRLADAAVSELVADNEEGRARLAVLSAIKKHGGRATRREITRATQKLERRHREDALRTLVDSGHVAVSLGDVGKRADVYELAND